nr:hypothetical protein BHI3_26470 [Bacteriovorax sp. HI3]
MKLSIYPSRFLFILISFLMHSCAHSLPERKLASSSLAIDRAVKSFEESGVTDSEEEIYYKEHHVERISKKKAILEIINLKEGDRIPESILLNYSSEEIAESIIERIAQQNRDADASFAKGFLHTSDVQLFFPEKLLDDVIREKEFLNIHQVSDDHIRANDTGGTVHDYRRDRVSVESVLSGLDFSSPKNELARKKMDELRPKSAFLVPKDLSEDAIAFGYGEIVAIPKDNLRKRMTWTPMDSYATPEDLVQGETFFSTRKEAPEVFRYYEAQIWGKLSISDIEEFWISPKTSTATLEKLKKLKIPIYFYNTKVKAINNTFKMPVRNFRGRSAFDPQVKSSVSPTSSDSCSGLFRKIINFLK